MQRSHRTRALTIVVLTVLLALSIAIGPVGQAQTPRRGGTLRVSLYADLAGLDPNRHGLHNAVVHWNIFESLLRFMPDGSLAPALATSWEWLSDREIRFRLRKGVKFHSGAPFDAHAVKWNADAYTNPKDPGVPFAMVGNLIEETIVEDEYTVRFKLAYPFVPFLRMCAVNGGIPIRDPGQVQKLGEDFARRPSGTGPFKFKEWKTGEYVLLERNPDWWGKDEGPYVDYLKFVIIPDPATRVMALESGAIDVALEVPPEDFVRLSRDKRFVGYTAPSDRIVNIDFNWLKPIWQNRNMRKAISLAIDTEGMVKALIEPLGSVATSAYTSPNFAHTPQPFVEYNPAKAKAILAAEGWKPGPDGVLVKEGKKLSLLLGTAPTRDLRNKEMAEAAAAMLREVGIDVTIDARETGDFFTVLSRPDPPPWDLILSGFGTMYLDPTHGLFGRYHGSNIPPQGLNYGRRSGEPLDSLMAAEFKITDPEKRKKALQEIQKLMYEETILIPLWERANVWLMSAKVKGFKPHPIFFHQYLYVPVWLE